MSFPCGLPTGRLLHARCCRSANSRRRPNGTARSCGPASQVVCSRSFRFHVLAICRDDTEHYYLDRNLVSETLERTRKKNPLTDKKFDCAFMRIILKFQRVFFANLLDINGQDSINFYSGELSIMFTNCF